MPGMMPQVDWSTVRRRALGATEIVTALAQLEGWRLQGEGPHLAIHRVFTFANYHETMAFVNAVAFIAHVRDHHPTLEVTYNRCAVSLNTHDVHGLSVTDMECAAAIDALLKPAG